MLGMAEKCSAQMKKAKLDWEQVEETGGRESLLV